MKVPANAQLSGSGRGPASVTDGKGYTVGGANDKNPKDLLQRAKP